MEVSLKVIWSKNCQSCIPWDMIGPFRIRFKVGSDNYQIMILKSTDLKYKLQRDPSVDIFVKERVKWPHDFVLTRNTKDRITCNQLNITHWMADYCRILRDENCQQTKDHSSDYLIALLDDSNDFLWQAVKASHAVLLCHMEQGEVTSWSHTEKNDQIRRVNAQRYVVPSQLSNNSKKSITSESKQVYV